MLGLPLILWLISLMYRLPGSSSPHLPILPPHPVPLSPLRGGHRISLSGSGCASLAPAAPVTPSGWYLQHQIVKRKITEL